MDQPDKVANPAPGQLVPNSNLISRTRCVPYFLPTLPQTELHPSAGDQEVAESSVQRRSTPDLRRSGR